MKERQVTIEKPDIEDMPPDLAERFFADLIGMPRICAVKRCRRLKKCLGPGALCLRHHWGLAEERMDRDRRRNAPEQVE